MRATTLLTAAAAVALPHLLRRRRRIDFEGRVVLLTGARGLALELARVFGDEGARLALLARDADELAAARETLGRGTLGRGTLGRGTLGRADVRTYVCDVRDQEAVERTVAAVVGDFGALDVVVNNAGVIEVGPFEHHDAASFRDAMDVHTWGALYTVRAARRHLAASGRGRVVNIASIGGLVAVPHLLPYTTSKFALVGLSDGLRAELRADGIRVTTVCPGLMRTGSHVRARFRGQREREYAWFAVADATPGLSMAADEAARKIVDACRHGDARLVLTLPARLAHALDTLAPGLVAAGTALAARLLPSATGAEGDRAEEGWRQRGGAVPGALTAPADEAIGRNNESVGRGARG